MTNFDRGNRVGCEDVHGVASVQKVVFTPENEIAVNSVKWRISIVAIVLDLKMYIGLLLCRTLFVWRAKLPSITFNDGFSSRPSSVLHMMMYTGLLLYRRLFFPRRTKLPSIWLNDEF